MAAPIKHARLSASGSETWVNCPGSVKLVEELFKYEPDKNDANFYSAEGSVAHTLADEYFSASVEPSEFLDAVILQDGFSIKVNEEMVAGVEYFISYIKDVLPTNAVIHSEVKIPLFYSPKEYGTSDIIAFDPQTRTLHVIDLKYGKGVRVEVEDNTQLLIYGISSLERYIEMQEPVEKVVLHIVQPRLKHNPSREYSLKELAQWSKKIGLAARLAELDDQPLNPGESQCKWCKARTSCAALAEYNYSTAYAMFDDNRPPSISFPDIRILTQEQKRNILFHRSAIEKWLKAIHDETFDLLLHGGDFPGFKLVEGRANRVWTNEKDVEWYLEQFLETKHYLKVSLRSPSEMEKLLKPKKSPLRAYIAWEEFSTNWITKNRGKPTLAMESDPRKPLSINPDDVFNIQEDDDTYNDYYED